MKNSVSIITVNLNNAIGLEKTIRSYLLQDYKYKELIIIDGLSSDSSLDVISKYKKYINFYISAKDTGIYNAMNKGILIAKKEWVFFLNSGDTFYSKKLFKKIFRNDIKKKEVIYGDIKYKNIIDNILISLNSEMLFKNLWKNNLFHQAALIRNKIHRKYLYNEKFKIIADFIFFYNLYKRKYNFLKLSLIFANVDNQGISSNNRIKSISEKKYFHHINKIQINYLSYYYVVMKALVFFIVTKLKKLFYLA
jgi:glycosyltransferase involved in cell wall biosynthesis